MKIIGIILAAGLSKRMGRVKSLLPWGDGLLLERVIENAYHSRLSGLVVVLGHEAGTIRKRVDFKEAAVVVNRDYAAGQSRSLQVGLGAVPVDTDGVMFLLGDQPFVDHRVIDRLIGAFQKQQSSLIIPTCQGKRGNPVLMHRSIFDMVKMISGDVGARVLFSRLSGRIREVEVADPGILVDIDTVEDYQRCVHQSAASPEGR